MQNLELNTGMKTPLFFISFILCFYPSITLKGQENKSSYKNQEAYLDSLWRKENVWNLGVAKITGEPIKDLSTIDAPKWAKWNYDLEEYFVSQMKYPAHLLRKNQAGYSVAMFSLDTLGLPRRINILTSIHKDFDKEVIRLIRDLPHCLPCRDKNGKRMECLYTVYVPFLPQRYRDRVTADSIAEEELKHCFVEWEEQASFQDGNPHAVRNYIYSKLKHNSDLMYKQKQVRGVYSISIDSYGEVTKTKTLQSCGIQEWDSQVEKIIKGMPRWTPTINHYGKGEYRRSLYTVSVWLKK